MVSEHLINEYNRLNERLQALQQQGIAPENVWLSPNYRETKKGIRTYQRLNTKTERGTATKHLGVSGCIKHRDWQAKIDRRNEASELKLQMKLLNQLMGRQAGKIIEATA